jgi:hypothetical protein
MTDGSQVHRQDGTADVTQRWAVKVSPYRGLLLVGRQIRHSSKSDEMLTAVIANGGTLGAQEGVTHL